MSERYGADLHDQPSRGVVPRSPASWRDACQPSPGRAAERSRGVARLVGDSRPMRELKARIRRLAASPFPVVIHGESGTGKELIARAIHEEGPRGHAVFVPVNCAILGDELFESELFGHAKGAFTSASRDRKGLLELSSGGTVFLDEVTELSPGAQAKLLRVLQDGEVRRLGENRTQWLDLRVVAATNRPLDDEAAAGRFRRDLLYRLKVLELTAPPLRDRTPDIAQLTAHYWDNMSASAGSRASLARETVTALAAHPWPGNVRELQNVLANLTVTGPVDGAVGPDVLPAAIRREVPAERRPTLAQAREELERAMVTDALGRHSSISGAAGELGITRQGLSKLMVRLRVDRLDPTCDRRGSAALPAIPRGPSEPSRSTRESPSATPSPDAGAGAVL